MDQSLLLHHTSVVGSPRPSADGHSREHSRQYSILSAATATTSRFSQPSDPLLPAVDSDAYHDMSAYQLHPENEGGGTHWHHSLHLEGDPITEHEKRQYWELSVRKRMRRLRVAKRVTFAIIGMFKSCTVMACTPTDVVLRL